MTIMNITKNVLLANQFEICETVWQKTRGMMFRKKTVPLVFKFSKKQIIRLHSWFCPGPIDLIFLNDAWEVTELKSEWQQKKSYTSQNKAMFLLELPAGTI